MTDSQRLLKFGDVVILGHQDPASFLTSDGFAEVRAALTTLNATAQTITNIEDATFEIQPSQSYVAMKRFRETMEQMGKPFDEDTLQELEIDDKDRRTRRISLLTTQDTSTAPLKLQVMKERKANEDLIERNIGEVIAFGEEIQLLHVKSGLYLTMSGAESAEGDLRAMLVKVDRPSSAAVWKLEPRFKMHAEGQAIHGGDHACLRSMVHGLYLFGNHSHKFDFQRCEVNGNKKKDGFKLTQYSPVERDDLTDDVLNGGEAVRLYSKESEGYLVLAENQHTITCLYTPDHQKGVSNSLFVVEFTANSNGGLCKWSNRFRIRHITTKQYLCAGEETTTDNETERGFRSFGLSLVDLETGITDPRTEFFFEATYGGDEYVMLQSSFRLVNVETAAYVHVLNDEGDLDPGEEVQLGVNLSTRSMEQDTLVLMRVAIEEIQEVNTVMASQNGLVKFKQALAEQGLKIHKSRLTTADRLLTKLILFVTTNSNNPNPLTREGTPIPKRQVLLYEQQVLQVVVETLDLLFHGPSKLLSLSGIERRHSDAPYFRLTRLSHRLLKQALRDNQQCSDFLTAHVPMLQEELAEELSCAAETIMELFRNNERQLQKLDDAQLETFVKMITTVGRKPHLIDFISAVATCNSVGVARNQSRAIHLLLETYPTCLFPLQLQGTDIQIKNDEKNDAAEWENFAEFCNNHHNEAACDFVVATLETLAQLCVGRNRDAQELVAKTYSEQLLMAITTNTALPAAVRKGALELVKYLYLDTHPFEVKAYIANICEFDSLTLETPGGSHTAFEHLKTFILGTLRHATVMVASELNDNEFFCECLSVLKMLIEFGFLSIAEIKSSIPLLVQILDGRTDKLFPDQKEDNGDRYKLNENTTLLFKAKHIILDTLPTMNKYLANQDKTALLQLFRTRYDDHKYDDKGHVQSQQQPQQPKPLSSALMGKFKTLTSNKNSPYGSGLGVSAMVSDLINYNDLALAVKSLQLLISLYGRQEFLLQVLNDTTILVVQDSVQTFHMALRSVEELRGLITDGITPEEEVRAQEILDEFSAVALTQKVNQQILSSVGAHLAAIRFLRLFPREALEASPEHRTACMSCYRFLTSFVSNNSTNQLELFEFLDTFLAHLGLGMHVTDLLIAIFKDNRTLCQNLKPSIIRKVFQMLVSGQLYSRYAEFLSTVLSPEGRPIKRNQDFVFGLLEEHPQTMLLLTGEDGRAKKLALLAEESAAHEDSLISYHLSLVNLLNHIAMGLNATTEIKLQAVFPLAELFTHMSLDNTPKGKAAVLSFFLEVFVDTERPVEIFAEESIWEFLERVVSTTESYATAPEPEMHPFVEAVQDLAKQFCTRFVADFPGGGKDNILGRLVEACLKFYNVDELARSTLELVRVVGTSDVADSIKEACAARQPQLLTRSRKLSRYGSFYGSLQSDEALVNQAKDDFCDEFRQFVFFEDDKEDEAGDDEEDVDIDEDRDMIEESNEFKLLVSIMLPAEGDDAGNQTKRRLVQKLIEGITGESSGIPEEQTKMHLKILTSIALREDAHGSKRFNQNFIHSLGATQMVVDMISKHHTHSVLTEVLMCGIAIFSEGNDLVQQWLVTWLKGDSLKFFVACKRLLQVAQSEVPEVWAWWQRYDDIKAQLGSSADHDEILSLLNRLVETSSIKELLRFLQVICENHFTAVQRMLHVQPDNVQSIDLITEIAAYLFVLEQYGVDNHNIERCIQVFDTITEVCQGPIKEHQHLLAATKLPTVCNRLLSNNFEIANLTPEEADDMENKEFDLKGTIANTLLALMEGCRDKFVPEHIAAELDVEVMRSLLIEGYEELMEHMGEGQEGKQTIWQRLASVGKDLDIDSCEGCLMAFQVFFLLQTVSDFSESMHEVMEEWRDSDSFAKYYSFYLGRTGCIEINDGSDLQRVYFRNPDICLHLSEKTKEEILWTVDRSGPSKRVDDFQGWFSYIYAEMRQLDKLENHRLHLFFELRAYDILITKLEFLLAVVINIMMLAQYTLKDKNLGDVLGRVSWERLTNCWNAYCAGGDTLSGGIASIDSESCQRYMSIDGNITQAYSDCESWWDAMDFGGADPHLPANTKDAVLGLGAGLLLLALINFVLFCSKYALLIIRTGIDKSPGTPIGWLLKHQTAKELAKNENVSAPRLALANTYFLLNNTGFLNSLMIVVLAAIGIAFPLAFSAHLFIMVQLSGDLQNVIRAVTKNGRSLLVTAFLGIAVVYVYGIFGFQFFRGHFQGNYGVLCEDLFQCSAVALSSGLRKYDIGEIMDKAGTEWNGVGYWFWQFSYFVVVLIILLNIIFGIIVDTFSELRVTRTEILKDMTGVCFICGIDANTFDRFGSGFQRHIRRDHNMWQYAFFFVHLMQKDSSDFTGPELHVSRRIEAGSIDWFPLGQAIELLEVKAREEEAQKTVQTAVKDATRYTKQLKRHIDRMRSLVEESRTDVAEMVKRGVKSVDEAAKKS